jgi:hypothetical protein
MKTLQVTFTICRVNHSDIGQSECDTISLQRIRILARCEDLPERAFGL